MKRKHKQLVLTSLVMMAASILPFFAMAQDPGGGPDAPIDGGLSLLLAAGAAYGVKKYRDNRKPKQEEEK